MTVDVRSPTQFCSLFRFLTNNSLSFTSLSMFSNLFVTSSNSLHHHTSLNALVKISHHLTTIHRSSCSFRSLTVAHSELATIQLKLHILNHNRQTIHSVVHLHQLLITQINIQPRENCHTHTSAILASSRRFLAVSLRSLSVATRMICFKGAEAAAASCSFET